MTRLNAAAVFTICLTWCGVALAQDSHDPSPTTPAHADQTHAVVEAGQPILPRNASWAGVMVIVILGGFFLPAAVIGPIARALAPEEEPVTHSHDEPHDSHGHHDAHGHH